MFAKSIRKRIKFTKTGKVLCRVSGQNHFNAKESSTVQKRKKKIAPFSKTLEKSLRQYAIRNTKR